MDKHKDVLPNAIKAKVDAQIEQLVTGEGDEMRLVDGKTMWMLLEQSRALTAEAEYIEKKVKEVCRTLIKDGDHLALDGDRGYYIQEMQRKEVPVIDAERIVEDKTMLYDILKVDMKKAEELLEPELFEELKAQQVAKGDPIRKMMVGKVNI